MRVVIELTNRCNLRCLHCFSGRHGGKDDLPWAVVENVLAGAKPLGFTHLTFTGGEPTLYKRFDELLAQVAGAGYRFSFVSNGHTLGHVYPKLLPHREALEQITFSLDGATPETHDELRGPAAFERVRAAMRRCHKEALPFSNNFVVTRHNRHELAAAAELAFTEGSIGLRFGHLLHSPLTTAQGFDLTLEERGEVDTQIEALREQWHGRLPVALAPGFATADPLPCAPLHMQEVNVDAHGYLTKCCHLSSYTKDKESGEVGRGDVVCDLRETDFKEGFLQLFLRNEQFKRAKAAHFAGPLRAADTSPCWYCVNHFGKVEWLKAFPEHPWLEHLWSNTP